MTQNSITRRGFLHRAGLGVGGIALNSLLQDSSLMGASHSSVKSLTSRPPHFQGKAKAVIHFFLNGGLSHVDSFDPKPALKKYAGRKLPSGNLRTERKTGAAFPSPFSFDRYGQSGLEISELFPKIGQCADDIAVVRSMKVKVPNHEPSLMLMNCGNAVLSRPSLGSWLTYGLGSENQNLPGFVAMCPGGYPIKEAENWQSGFLPGSFQGTYIDSQHKQVKQLLENIRNRHLSLDAQRNQLDLLNELNQGFSERSGTDPQLEARIQSFELAYRMQSEASQVFDINNEPASIRQMYGEGIHGRQTLIARRLVERGVRFVQLWHGAGQPWDNHENIQSNHGRLARELDQPVAALINDLRQRGLLDQTLILFTGEFGRTPTVELSDSGKSKLGRDHNPYGFSLWMAGGGIKGGTVFGSTDEFGFSAEENPLEVHDLHATILHLLGFDHQKFTYRHAGRDFRLTDVGGKVIQDIVA